MYLRMKNPKIFCQTSYFILIILYSLVSCNNPSLNGLVTINDNNDQMQEESSSYLHFARIPDEDDTRKILLAMGNQSVQSNSDDLDLSASSNLANILTNVNIDNEQRHLQQQLQTNEDPLQKILPKVKFDCKDRKEGYYADPDFNCEVFHYCKSNGYRFTLVCPIKSRYSMKAMTCVYEDHKLYECPGVDANSTIQSIDGQLMNSQQTGKLNEETSVTTNSSSIDKNSMVQLIETNKMSSWNDIINRNNKYANNPAQLNNNDIMESLNQITTTLSSPKLNDDIISSNSSDILNSTGASESTSNEQISAQFGTRFSNNSTNTNSNSSKNSRISTLKKIASSPGYEDLYTKYQKRKKFKTTTSTTTTSTNSLQQDESANSGGETESIETGSYTTIQSTNGTDKTYSSEQNVPNDQILSTLSTINDQSNNNFNHHSNHHHSDYKEINDQSYPQFTAYQTANDDLVQPIKIGQMNKESNNLNLSTNTFNSQYDQSTESGFKPIFMQKMTHQQSNKPMNQFKFTNSQLVIKDQLDSIDSLVSSVNRERDNTISASSTSNPVLFTDNTNSTKNTIINELNQLKNNQTLSNNLAKNNLAYQTRDQYRLMVKDVSDQKLKDFIKNNDLIDLSSTAISTNTPSNSPQIVPQFLKERRSRIKTENLVSSNLRQNQTTKPQSIVNWPKSSIQFQNNDNQQFLNYWPYLNGYQNLNFQNLNKKYNSYTLDNIVEDPAYKYDYVFGLSKVLPSINANFPPFLPDKNFMLKYPALFNEYYSPADLQLINSLNSNNKFIAPSPSLKKASNQLNQERPTSTDTSSLPSWLKSKFSLKSPISRNTNANSNTNANNKNNALFSNTNNFLHSAASSSFNYPLYELPPPSLLKQQHQTRTQQQSPMGLISPTNSPNSQQQQYNNLLNSPLLNSQLNGMPMVNSPNNLLFNQLISTTTAPQTQQSQQQNSNTRKTFFSQLSRLFSSASMARPVRVPYTTANLASAFSSLTQPFSKLQIDNLSNQLFSPFKGFLNATTSYIPIRKDPTATNNKNSNSNEPNNDEVDELDELEKQILNANGLSQYTLNPSSINQQSSIGQQSTSNLGQNVNQNNLQNPLNFNAYNNYNQMPMGQSLYGPIKRSSLINKSQQPYHLQMPLKREFYTTTATSNYLQPQQVRSLMNKPNEIVQQQSTNNPPQFSTTFPQSYLANKHDLMDEFLLENGSDFFDDYGKRKKRRKRSVAPIHAIHYPPAQPKFTFPFLAPYQFSAPPPPPMNSLSMPTYLPGYFAPPPPIHHHPFNNYASTPVLPPIVSAHSFDKKAKLLTAESQFKPQIVTSSITPTPSSANLKSQQSTGISSSFGTLSLASAASQLAYSLANISKNHKNTKIGKHLSKLTASSNFLPSISNLTSYGFDNYHQLNKTMPATAKVIVYQKPPGKSTLTAYSFSSIPGVKEFADFPFFNQYNTLRNLPSTAYLIADTRATNLHHPFNSQFNSLDLNSFPYHTMPTTNHPYPLTPQLPKLHVEYRPANKITVNPTIKTSDNFKSNTDIDENYGGRKLTITTNEFRDLLNAYKQVTNKPTASKELYMPFKSIYSTSNESKEGQIANNQQQYSPDYSSKASILFKSLSNAKESFNASPVREEDPNYPQQTNIKPTLSSKYQSQSSNNRLIKQQLSSGRSLSPEYELSKLKDDYSEGERTFDNDEEDDNHNHIPINVHTTSKKAANHFYGGRKGFSIKTSNDENPSRLSSHQTKSMNKNLKLSNKKSDYLDNYHEPADDQEDEIFFSKDFTKSSKNVLSSSKKLTGRQLSKNADRAESDFEDDFFNEQPDERNVEQYPSNKPKSMRTQTMNKHSASRPLTSRPQIIAHNANKIDHRQLINKSSRKLIKTTKDEVGDDELNNLDDNTYQTNYDTNDTHQRQFVNTAQAADNYLNKNQLNFQPNAPRSILVKQSSYSFEIPNHSEHEEVEFDDHIGKQHKIRPSYMLDQTSRKTTGLIYNSRTEKHDQPYHQATPTMPEYYDSKASKFSSSGGKSNDEELHHNLVPFKTEKQQRQFSTIIEHSTGNRKSTNQQDDDLFNQFDIKRQPNLIANRNHHLPHSHIDDVEAYYKASSKKPNKGKFKQFFHQQELKHTAAIKEKNNRDLNIDNEQFSNEKHNESPKFNSGQYNESPKYNEPYNESPKYNNGQYNESPKYNNGQYNESPKYNNGQYNESPKYNNVQYNEPPKYNNRQYNESPKPTTQDESSSASKTVNESPIKKDNKMASSPLIKPPRVFVNWHSSINHSLKDKTGAKPAATKNVNDNDFKIFEDNNDNNYDKINHKNDMNKLNKIKTNIKSNFNNIKNNQGPTRSPLDDEWFKQDWFKAPELNEPSIQKPSEQNKTPNNPPQPKVIKNENLDNNDIDSGEIEYEDDPLQTPIPVLPVVPPNNQRLNNRQTFNKLKTRTPIKLQVMDQQNKQYTPTTTTTTTTLPPILNNQQTDPSPKHLPHKTKFLSSSKFIERQKYKTNLKPTSQPSTTTTSTKPSETNPISSAKESGKKYEYQKAKLINMQYRKDKKSENPKPFTRTTKQSDKNNNKNVDMNMDKNMDKNTDKNMDKNTDKNKDKNNDSKQSDQSDSSRKVVMNTNLQNSSSTINAQILDKLPISVESIFDNIDEENFDYETDSNPNVLQNKRGDLPAENNMKEDSKDNENLSNEMNTLNDDQTTTNQTSTEQYGTRITGNGKLQPKVSFRTSYSSVSSTQPRAMAQRMDTQKIDAINFRSLDHSEDLTLKKETNPFKNRMKQFKKQSSWLSPLMNLNSKNLDNKSDKILDQIKSDKNTTTSSPVLKNELKLNSTTNKITADQERKNSLFVSWKGFNSRQQKLIDQKKNLDDKSMAPFKKPISPYLNKFRKEFNHKNLKDLDKNNELVKSKETDKEQDKKETLIETTTSKSTSTTVPTTTLKSIVIESKHNQDQINLDKFNSDKFNADKFNADKINSDKFKILNSTKPINSLDSNNLNKLNNSNRTEHYSTSTTVSTSSSWTNYNLSFNNHLNSPNSRSNLNSNPINNSINNSINSVNNSTNNQNNLSTKPYKRIFSAFSGGAIQTRSRN